MVFNQIEIILLAWKAFIVIDQGAQLTFMLKIAL